MSGRWITLGKTTAFLKQSAGLLSEDELREFETFLSCNPEAGDVIPDSGGLRKIRLALGSRGKSRGARVIYFYYTDEMPIYLLAVYAKNEKIDISNQERAMMRAFVANVIKKFKTKKEKLAG